MKIRRVPGFGVGEEGVLDIYKMGIFAGEDVYYLTGVLRNGTPGRAYLANNPINLYANEVEIES